MDRDFGQVDPVASLGLTPKGSGGPAASPRQLMGAFWGAAALSVLLHLLQPYGGYVLYPFAFLATWAHEMGHGLTAILVGESFRRLEVYQTLGGVAYFTQPQSGAFWRMPLIAAGGLLGPALAGGVVIVLGARARTAPWVLGALALALWLSLAFWVRNWFGAGAVSAIALALTALAIKAPALPRIALAQLIGIQLCLGSLASFDYMFTKGFERDGKLLASDTQQIAQHLLLPYWFWGGLIAALSLAILAGAFYLAWVRPLRAPQAAQGGLP